jgi:hypothetical protein
VDSLLQMLLCYFGVDPRQVVLCLNLLLHYSIPKATVPSYALGDLAVAGPHISISFIRFSSSRWLM